MTTLNIIEVTCISGLALVLAGAALECLEEFRAWIARRTAGPRDRVHMGL